MKTLLITGASSGIGQAIVDKLKGRYQLITPSHIELDLANTDSLQNYMLTLPETLDGIIHVAGFWHEADHLLANKKLAEFTDDQIKASIAVGLTAFILLSKALLPRMKDGFVVGITGTFADGGAGWLPYYVSKRAQEDFLVGLASDYPNVQVFGVSPADTATKAYKKFYPEYAQEAQPPSAVAQVISDLLENRTEYVSGDIIEVRDGKTLDGFHV